MKAIDGILAVLNLQSGSMNTLADSLDRWVESYTWSPDSTRLFFTIDDHGTNPLHDDSGDRRRHSDHRARTNFGKRRPVLTG